MPTDRIYAPADRPDVIVSVDGTEYPGELRAWFWRDDAWVASVQWHRAPGETLLDTFAAGDVRLDDESYKV